MIILDILKVRNEYVHTKSGLLKMRVATHGCRIHFLLRLLAELHNSAVMIWNQVIYLKVP
jgi:hypothetical protein